jgi:hypothetical protein
VYHPEAGCWLGCGVNQVFSSLRFQVLSGEGVLPEPVAVALDCCVRPGCGISPAASGVRSATSTWNSSKIRSYNTKWRWPQLDHRRALPKPKSERIFTLPVCHGSHRINPAGAGQFKIKNQNVTPSFPFEAYPTTAGAIFHRNPHSGETPEISLAIAGSGRSEISSTYPREADFCDIVFLGVFPEVFKERLR